MGKLYNQFVIENGVRFAPSMPVHKCPPSYKIIRAVSVFLLQNGISFNEVKIDDNKPDAKIYQDTNKLFDYYIVFDNQEDKNLFLLQFSDFYRNIA